MYKGKIARLIALDAKRNIVDKILIMIELVVCIVLLLIGLSGLYGANHIKYLYKDLNGVHIEGFSLEGMPENEKINLQNKILSENKVGKIELVTGAHGFDSKMAIYGYSSVMLDTVPIKLKQGKMFSDNYNTQEYREIILGYNFALKYQVGDFITDKDIGTIGNNKYKIIGFLQNNYGILDHQYRGVSNEVGIVKTDISTVMDGTIVFTNDNAETFMRKYGIYEYYLQDIEDNISRLRINTISQLLARNMDSFEQIMSFFNMFLIIALGVYFTTIVSTIVIRFNDNLLFNKNMVRIGVTKREFLLVKLINIAMIALISIIISVILVLTIVAPNIFALVEYATVSAELVVIATAIVLGSFVAIDIAEMFIMQKHLKKEQK